MKNIKIVELFGGIGSPTIALKQLGYTNKNIIDVIENNPQAIKSYNAIHKTNYKIQDIRTWDKDLGEIDYLHASTPCQAFSTAGKNLGGADYRGIELWEHTVRIIKKLNPKLITLENVKGLLQKKHKPVTDWYINQLELLGYKNEIIILNAKNFGVPQNRERVFIISSKIKKVILPKKVSDYPPTLNSFLREDAIWMYPKVNILAKNWKTVYIENNLSIYNGKIIAIDVHKLLNQKRGEINRVAVIKKRNFEEFSSDDLLDLDFTSAKFFFGMSGVIGCIRASMDALAQNKIMEDISFNQDKNFFGVEGLSPTIVSNSPESKNKILDFVPKVRYRKLLPIELFLLMGFSEKNYYDALNAGVSNSQICKQAGNSIVVGCMKAILEVNL